MQKDEMTKEIGEQLATLRKQTESLNKLCDSLQMTLRGGDVSFSTVEEAKRMTDEVKPAELKASLDKTFKTLKARAQTRLKEI